MELGKLAEVQMGYSFRTRVEHNPLGQTAVIQMRDINEEGVLSLESIIRVDLKIDKTRHLLQNGDLILRSRGRSYGVALVSQTNCPTIVSSPMLLIRPHGVLPEYLNWFFNSPPTQIRLASIAEGTSVQMLSADVLKSFEVPVPSQLVQQKIVHFASLADREKTLLARISFLRQRLNTHLLMNFAQKAST